MRAEQSDWQGVIIDYSKIIELDPTFPDAWIGRARAYYSFRRFAEAEADLVQAEPLFKPDWIKTSAEAYVFEHYAPSDYLPDESFYSSIYDDDDRDFDWEISDLANDAEEDDGSILPTSLGFNDDDPIPF